MDTIFDVTHECMNAYLAEDAEGKLCIGLMNSVVILDENETLHLISAVMSFAAGRDEQLFIAAVRQICPALVQADCTKKAAPAERILRLVEVAAAHGNALPNADALGTLADIADEAGRDHASSSLECDNVRIHAGGVPF